MARRTRKGGTPTTRSKTRKSRSRSRSRSRTPQFVPKNGTVVKLKNNLQGTGAGGSQDKLGKVVAKNDETGKAIVRLFYNSSDHVLSYRHLQKKLKKDREPKGHNWNPHRAIYPYDRERLNN